MPNEQISNRGSKKQLRGKSMRFVKTQTSRYHRRLWKLKQIIDARRTCGWAD